MNYYYFIFWPRPQARPVALVHLAEIFRPTVITGLDVFIALLREIIV
jgi:hypothetical protein